ncbi:unnamed protein product [Owenia fusiformis]|uniref:DNA-directed RNA polymerases I and III subunit RPAC2 n=1 Tax=Owenia fusiformis TaxID=6347 RepID=A0A8J1XLT1_OWEFU|nr:unnamed protein product [Owenia fusiformis]
MEKKSDENRKRNLEVVQSSSEDETCQTFVLHNEDHTLGNSLRYMVMKNPAIEFCGYTIPHPSENKINFRIQTRGGPAVDALQKGLTDLKEVSGHILTTFESKVQSYKRLQQRKDEADSNMDQS